MLTLLNNNDEESKENMRMGWDGMNVLGRKNQRNNFLKLIRDFQRCNQDIFSKDSK